METTRRCKGSWSTVRGAPPREGSRRPARLTQRECAPCTTATPTLFRTPRVRCQCSACPRVRARTRPSGVWSLTATRTTVRVVRGRCRYRHEYERRDRPEREHDGGG